MTAVNGGVNWLRRRAGAVRRRVRTAVGRPASIEQPSKATPPRLPTTGMVETFEYWRIVGWVVGEPDVFPIRVSLYVNDLEVASTWADNPVKRNTWAEARGFRFALADIWKYCKKTDRVTVRIGDTLLPIAAKGIYKRPANKGEHSLADLQEAFANNYLFGQMGELQLSKKFDHAWQRSVIDLYRRVGDVVRERYGYEPFVIYGSLLGLVREGGFIGHDIDFDAAYVSDRTDGPSAAAELREIALLLVDHGFDVECKRTALHIHDQSDHELRIDLFHLYFQEGELRFPFGIVGPPKVAQDNWLGVAPAELAGHRVFAPQPAEAMAEHIYGASWRTPIAGFNWGVARTGWARDGWMPDDYNRQVHWENFYAVHEPDGASPFAEFVLARGEVSAAIVDIGCGDGRDTIALARAGKRAFGLDRSVRGVGRARARVLDAGTQGSATFVLGDAGEGAVVHDVAKQAREAADGGPVTFYLRFFLHAIPEDVQQSVVASLAAVARDGDVIAAEFRTDKDGSTPKVHPKHYRRFQDGFEFGRTLREDYGFAVVHEEEGTGLAVYADEDPVVYRIVAVRGDASGVASSSRGD